MTARTSIGLGEH